MENQDDDVQVPIEDDEDSEADWSDVDDDKGKSDNADDQESDSNDSVSGASANGSELMSSDDSDGVSEKCAICLQRFTGQEIGSPETCEHHFCLKCITEWSKKVAVCPMDRKIFPAILVKNELFGKVVRIVDVEIGNVADTTQFDDYDPDPTYCEICGHCDREDRLLLCDGCDLGYHLECLDPPMDHVPIENWYCSTCQVETAAVVETSPAGSSQRPSRRQLRLPRTGQSRRILESIRRSAYQLETSSIENNTPTRRKRKRTSRKISGRKTKRTSKRRKAKGSGTRGKRKSKKGRKSRVAIQRRPPTARARLAHQLGILPPRPGQVYVGLPRCRAPISQSAQGSTSSSSLHHLRYQAGITPLRIYSTSEDLADYLESYSDDEGGSVGVARVQSIHRLGNPCKSAPSIVSTNRSSRLFETAQASSSPDILGPILNNQIIMFTDRNIHIKRDGTLVPSITPTQSNRNPPSSVAGSGSSRRNLPTTTANPNDNYNDSRGVLGSHNLGALRDLRVPSANNNILNTPLNSYPTTSINEVGVRQVPISPNSVESSTTSTGTSSASYNNNKDTSTQSSTTTSLKDGDNSGVSSNSHGGSMWNSNSNDLYGGQNSTTSGTSHQDSSKAYENYLYSNNKAKTMKPSENSCKNKSNVDGGGEISESKDEEHDEDDEEYNIYSDIEEDIGNDEHHEGSNSSVKPEQPQTQQESGAVETEGTGSIKERGDSDSEMVIDDEYQAGVISGRERESRSSADSYHPSEDISVTPLGIQSSPQPVETLHTTSNQNSDQKKSYSHDYLPSPTSIPLPDSSPPHSDDDDDEISDPPLIISSPESESDSEEPVPVTSASRAQYDPSQPLTSSDEEEHSIKLTQMSSRPTSKKKKRRPQKKAQSPPLAEAKSPSSLPSTTMTASNRVAQPQPQSPPKIIIPVEEEEEEEDLDLNSIPIPPMPSAQEDYTRRPTIQFSIPTRHRLLPISSLIKRQKGVMRKETRGGNTLSFSSEISKAFGEDKMDESEDDANRTESEPRVNLVAEIFGSDDDENEEEEPQQQQSRANTLTAAQPEDKEVTPYAMESAPVSALPIGAIDNSSLIDSQGQTQNQFSFPLSTNDTMNTLNTCRWKKSVVEQERDDEHTAVKGFTTATTTTTPTTTMTEKDQLIGNEPLDKPDTSIAEESDDSVSVLETIHVGKRKNSRNHPRDRRRRDDDDVVLLSTFTGVASNKEKQRGSVSTHSNPNETSVVLSSRRTRTSTENREKTSTTTMNVLESISDADSEFVVGDSSKEETLSGRIRSKPSRRERDKENNMGKEKDKLKEKDKKALSVKRKRSSSPQSNCEEGEIVDSPEKRRKKRKEKKKTKRRKKSKDSKSSRIDFSEKKLPEVAVPAPNSSSEDNLGDNLVTWKKPSNTRERNYRDGKPKQEESYFRARDKKHEASPHDRREKHNNRDKSPPRDKAFNKGRNDGKRSRRRSTSLTRRRSHSKSRSPGWNSRSRSFSKSRINDKRFNSRSNRSSSSSKSNKSFRSRSRSRSLRYGRRHRRVSASPRRSRSLSRTPLRLRSRSPVKRTHIRKKSLSSSRSRRFRTRQRSSSVSSSASARHDERRDRKKRKDKIHGGEKQKKRKEKDRVVREESSLREKEKDKEKDKKRRRRRREKSVSPAKAIFADGDSIVVSLNFQKGNTSGGVGSKDNCSPSRNESESDRKKSGRRQRRGRSTEKDSENSSKPRLLKKTLLIDLETSPIQEQNIGVSPTLIVLSDEDEEHREQTSLDGKGSSERDVDMDSTEIKDGVTSCGDGGSVGEGGSPYRHGVAADSTQIQQPNQSDSKMDDSYSGSMRTPGSPYEEGNLSPRGGDSLVTSTRDSEIGLPHDNDSGSQSPTTPQDTTTTKHQIHPRSPPPILNNNNNSSSRVVTASPPLPRESPPPTYMVDTRSTNETSSGTPSSSSVSNGQTLDRGPGASIMGTGKPLVGIGNIPGLFPSNISTNSVTGSMSLPPPPVVIPAPPTQQLPRFTPTVNQNLLTSNVLASVAALYGPLMAVRQQQQSAMSGKFSNAAGGNLNVIGNKGTQQQQVGGSSNGSNVLLPKNQIAHGNRSKSSHFAGGSGNSPFSPNSSDGDDLFEPPLDQMDSGGKSDKLNSIGSQGGASNSLPNLNSSTGGGNDTSLNAGGGKTREKNSLFDTLFGTTGKKSSAPANHQKSHDKSTKKGGSHHKSKGSRGAKKEPPKQLSEGELRLTEDVPTSAVELRVKEKFLKKLNRQERVVEEVKLSLKPHYSKKHVTKDEYKEILRRAVPKICHNKTGEINPFKIKELVEAYVKKFRHSRKN